MPRIFNKKIERPLANVHWVVLVLLIAPYIIYFLASTCSPPLNSFICSLLTATILVIFWVRHLGFYPINGGSIFLAYLSKVLVDIFLFFVLLIVILIPLTIVTPTYDCYTSRTKISEMLVLASPVRLEIEERALMNHSLQGAGLGLSIDPAWHLGRSIITSEGIIILVEKEPVGAVVLTPSLLDDKVTWRCDGYPKKIMPVMCRE